MWNRALSLIGMFAVVIAASIVASAALDLPSESTSGARLSSTKEGQQLDYGRTASTKPLDKIDNVTGTACDSYYTIYGGSREQFRGTYDKGSASMMCNGHAIYIQSAADPYYLYYTGARWMISSQSNMQDCKNSGFIESANDCACPEKCTDTCTGCGAFGAWKESTGKKNGATDGATCNEDSWCDSGIWTY